MPARWNTTSAGTGSSSDSTPFTPPCWSWWRFPPCPGPPARHLGKDDGAGPPAICRPAGGALLHPRLCPRGSAGHLPLDRFPPVDPSPGRLGQADADAEDLFRLEPGGAFIHAEMALGTPWPRNSTTGNWQKQLETSGFTTEELATIRERMACDRPAPIEHQLVWMRQAGFADVDSFFADLSS